MTEAKIQAKPSENLGDDQDVTLVVAILGLATSLVALAQVWRLFEVERLWWLQPLDAVLSSGRVGVTMVASCVGYLCALSVLRGQGSALHIRAARMLGPVVLAWVLTALAFAAVLCSASLDDRNPSNPDDLRALALPVLGLYWNQWIVENPLGAPSSLSGLWVISVLVQLWVAVVVVVALLARWPRALAAALLAVASAAAWWRTTQVLDGAWFEASLHVAGLADAFCLGAAAMVGSAIVGTRRPRWSAGVFSGAVLAGAGAVLAGAFYANDGVVVGVAPTAGLLAATACLASTGGRDRSMLVTSFLGHPRLARAWTAWPAVLLWSQTVAVEAQIRTVGVDQWVRVVAAAILLVIAVLLTRTLVLNPFASLADRLSRPRGTARQSGWARSGPR